MPTTSKPNQELNLHDLLWAARRLPSAVRDGLKAYPKKLVLAGGFIRSIITREEISDIDLFVPDVPFAQTISGYLTAEGYKEKITDNALTMTKFGATAIQIIHRWTYDSPEKVIPSFDFTIARAAIWWDNIKMAWISECDPDYYADLAAKRLVYRCPVRNEDGGGSILRVLKFYQRGYRIPLDSLGEVIARCIKDVDFRSIQDRNQTDEDREHDKARIITGLLREVDPAVDPDHIFHLPAETLVNEDCKQSSKEKPI